MNNFLFEEAEIKLRANFKATDNVKCFEDYPLLKDSFKKILKKTKSIKTFVMKSAIKHSQRSALDWSTALGGPLKSTIKYNGCSPKIKVLPFLDMKNMYEHLHEFKRITEKQLGMQLQCRKSDDENGRLLHGLSTYHPFKQVRLHLSKYEQNSRRQRVV